MIYFIQPVDGGPIKIGTTKNLDSRLWELEGYYGTPLAVLATMEGGRAEEREIHERFAHLRLGRTEQFRPAADLLEFIGKPLLVHPDPEAVEVRRPVRSVPITVVMDTYEYRDWLRGISEATLIPVATIVRDALAKWAAERGLPRPPSGPGSTGPKAPKSRK